jgi:antitoxin component YwqK of YwqJK toxin-antitoxin module
VQSNKLYYPSGTLYADITEAARSYFYENGRLKTFEPYQDERLHGEVVLYWPNGQMKRRSHFQLGIREGLDQIWSEEGKLVDEGSYEKGKPIGTHRRWTPRGDLIEEIEYIDLIRFNFRQWDELGQVRFEGIWTDENYFEKTWDRFQMMWTEKQGRWDGKKLVYV